MAEEETLTTEPSLAPTTAETAEEEETEELEDDETPQDGDILEPGLHLLEVVTQVPCRREVLLEGLSRIGFKGLLPDQSRIRAEAAFPTREHRVIGDLTRGVTLHQRDIMEWTYVRRLAMTNVGREMKDYRLKLSAFDLEPGVRYEALFMSRARTQPSRKIVEEHLNDMGFVIDKLTAVQRDARIIGRQTTSVTIWFGILEWDSVASPVTEDDPFYFEELIAI